MDPTIAQTKRINYLRSAFGKDAIKPHAPNPKTGLLRVEATCLAGVWQWYFDADGNMVARHQAQRLFDPPEPQAKPRNAIDN